MVSSAPSATTIMNGKPSQVLVITFAENDVAHEPNQSTFSRPQYSRIDAIAPCSFSKMPFQISAVM